MVVISFQQALENALNTFQWIILLNTCISALLFGVRCTYYWYSLEQKCKYSWILLVAMIGGGLFGLFSGLIPAMLISILYMNISTKSEIPITLGIVLPFMLCYYSIGRDVRTVVSYLKGPTHPAE